ncbi:MAG: biopolymer transporter ExbD [Proteobacteria bacterium]|nr:biopolymer transporter ExbD [Pseudomonadota bacterium]
MPVHPAGSRLYSAIPFKYLVKGGPGGSGAGGKSSNIDLNLTPFVDMMTILVTFLLMVFSASGEILTQQAGLELPSAGQQADIQRAPVIIITQQSITFNGEHMAETESVFDDQSTQWKVVELCERLKAERRAFDLNFDKLPDAQRERCLQPNPTDKIKCERGLAILQADRRIKAKVISRVLKTANAAGYNNIMFAVERGAGPPGGAQ